MKIELETIPVWDGVKSESECFICDLMNKAEEDAVDYYLGPAIMVPEIRVEINRKGFCPAHFRALAARNKWGAAAGLASSLVHALDLGDDAARRAIIGEG